MNGWVWFHVCYSCFFPTSSPARLSRDKQYCHMIRPEWRFPRRTCLLSWSRGWTSLSHQSEAWQPPPVTQHVEGFTLIIIRSHPPEDRLKLDQPQEETPQNHLHSHSGKTLMFLLAVCNVYLLHSDVIWQLQLWVEITGQWNPKMTTFCVLCVFVFSPHVFAVQLLAHGRLQTSRFFCFLSPSADLERPHLPEMAHLPDGRHGYFPQRLSTLSSWVTTCRVQLTLEAFPSETASDPGIATDGHSLPAEHVMPAKQKKCFRLDDVSLNLRFI